MPKYLVIVESPAKAKTIKKYLGNNYDVLASNGHVRDLPKSQLGIDIENDFEPKYITIRGKGDVLAKLRRDVKRSEKVFLATDPDREGEAISWHLANALKIDEDKYCRITFNEITKNAVKNSIKNAREIDMNLVDAQQARRAVDRIVGYEISPLLWEKIKRGLSAGRVQSATLRLICERENEINDFVPREYWNISASLSCDDLKKPFEAKLTGIGNNKIDLSSKEEVDKVLKDLKGKSLKVSEIKTARRQVKAPLPFTTSTLQQEANKQLNFSTQKTMKAAQQLYEGVEVKGHGTIGLITYLRTDSTRISDEAEEAVKNYIIQNHGADKYVMPKKETKGKNVQDAHEAIRPSYTELTPAEVKDSLPRDLFRLYQLIWRRFVASRMQPAEYNILTVKLSCGEYVFSANSSVLDIPGYKSVYTDVEEDSDEDGEKMSAVALDKLTDRSKIKCDSLNPSQHFTQPAPHFTESSLVKAMEELGIGRPSTYSPTITTLLARHYITKEARNLYVTELGEAVNNVMVTAFSSIVDLNFTATMETLLDGVAEGNVQWKTVVRNFYPDLVEAISHAQAALSNIRIEDEKTDVVCELCGRNMVIKYGPHGKFLACPGFPECKNTKPYFEKTGVLCPKCGKELVICKTKKGRKYYGCEGYPDCDYMTWQLPKKDKPET